MTGAIAVLAVYFHGFAGREETSKLPYVVGNAIEGYCVECKQDTVHTVLEIEGLMIRAVRCEKCRTEGPLKTPRSKTKAGLREVAAKRRTTPPRRRRRKAEDPAQIFRKHLVGKEVDRAKKYNPKAELEIGKVIKHPSFGIGVVVSMNEPQKASIVFEDGTRVLVCDRK